MKTDFAKQRYPGAGGQQGAAYDKVKGEQRDLSMRIHCPNQASAHASGTILQYISLKGRGVPYLSTTANVEADSGSHGARRRQI